MMRKEDEAGKTQPFKVSPNAPQLALTSFANTLSFQAGRQIVPVLAAACLTEGHKMGMNHQTSIVVVNKPGATAKVVVHAHLYLGLIREWQRN